MDEYRRVIDLVYNNSLQKKKLEKFFEKQDENYFDQLNEFVKSYDKFLHSQGLSFEYAVDAYFKLNNNNEIFDHNLGQHETSKDIYNIKKIFKQLFSERPAYMEALCRILIVDYICLPKYKLPTACAHLESVLQTGLNLIQS